MFDKSGICFSNGIVIIPFVDEKIIGNIFNNNKIKLKFENNLIILI